MSGDILETVIKKQIKIQRTLWSSFVTFPIVLGITAVIITQQDTVREAPSQTLIYTLIIMACISIIVSFFPTIFIPDSWIDRRLEEDVDAEVLARNSSTGELNKELADELNQLDTDDLQKFKIFSESLFPNIIRWGVVEGAALFGHVLCVLTLDKSYYFPLGTITFIRLLMIRPNPSELFLRIRRRKEMV